MVGEIKSITTTLILSFLSAYIDLGVGWLMFEKFAIFGISSQFDDRNFLFIGLCVVVFSNHRHQKQFRCQEYHLDVPIFIGSFDNLILNKL